MAEGIRGDGDDRVVGVDWMVAEVATPVVVIDSWHVDHDPSLERMFVFALLHGVLGAAVRSGVDDQRDVGHLTPPRSAEQRRTERPRPGEVFMPSSE